MAIQNCLLSYFIWQQTLLRKTIELGSLTKEADTMYTAAKKLTFYLEDVDMIFQSDHLPLMKFKQRNTLHVKVNN